MSLAKEAEREKISMAEYGRRSSENPGRKIPLAIERNRFFKEHKKLKYRKVS
ncbi:hypothetical protein LEP1GSC125_0455 [Leptospira mayottensis 200901122]|uniref:Uncharacterized protein n=1 Tax=Leptospira mayottensis 200901122 TaxID=1193010 RepID=A0AA87SVY4_9LEPT|nr:hypothetical protein LEP1GSC125_0455 [Leptospira mayottensis 200901122]